MKEMHIKLVKIIFLVCLMFYMKEKDEPELHAQHPKKLLERAFGAEADAGNGEYAQNTTAWD